MKTNFCFLIVIAFLAFALTIVSAEPNGAKTITEINSTRVGVTSPDTTEAIAGNVTEMNVYGQSVTQAWQAYFGNVTGAIQLGDLDGKIMYNWSLASPRGQVYASTSNDITWSSIECFNMTNSSAVEAEYNIDVGDSDGINETFNLNNHAAFNVGSTQFTGGQCNNTKLFNDAGIGTFDNVLLQSQNKVIFASLLQEDVTGFDAKAHDFEMLVLEDGHGTDTTTTPYYFYVELN